MIDNLDAALLYQAKLLSETAKGTYGILSMTIEKGIYRHFKGHVYEVTAIARHSESLEELVIYVSTNDPSDVWARPASMFLDTVERDGKTFKRFSRLDESGK